MLFTSVQRMLGCGKDLQSIGEAPSESTTTCVSAIAFFAASLAPPSARFGSASAPRGVGAGQLCTGHILFSILVLMLSRGAAPHCSASFAFLTPPPLSSSALLTPSSPSSFASGWDGGGGMRECWDGADLLPRTISQCGPRRGRGKAPVLRQAPRPGGEERGLIATIGSR